MAPEVSNSRYAQVYFVARLEYSVRLQIPPPLRIKVAKVAVSISYLAAPALLDTSLCRRPVLGLLENLKRSCVLNTPPRLRYRLRCPKPHMRFLVFYRIVLYKSMSYTVIPQSQSTSCSAYLSLPHPLPTRCSDCHLRAFPPSPAYDLSPPTRTTTLPSCLRRSSFSTSCVSSTSPHCCVCQVTSTLAASAASSTPKRAVSAGAEPRA